jgi:hypothetical protein
MLQAAPPTVIVQLTGHEASTHAIQPGAPAVHREPASGVVLEGRYPQLGAALGAWMQAERDPVERCRIAHDLGTIGSADAARSLLDGVRTGVLSPTIAVDNLERGGFDAGIAVAAALGDPSPDVRAVATSIVGRRAPLQASSLARAEHEPRPMPRPPRGPTGGHG